MLGWLKHFGSENHADERIAERWHIGHAMAYGVLILLYCGSIAWHVAAAARHRAAARRLADEAEHDGG